MTPVWRLLWIGSGWRAVAGLANQYYSAACSVSLDDTTKPLSTLLRSPDLKKSHIMQAVLKSVCSISSVL